MSIINLHSSVTSLTAKVRTAIHSCLLVHDTLAEKGVTTIITPYEVRLAVDLNMWFCERDLQTIIDECVNHIKQVDVNNMIHNIQYVGTPVKDVYNKLHALKPGQVLHAEMFFPTIEWLIKFKQRVNG